MALPGVNIVVLGGGLGGVIPTDDSKAGMVLTGVAAGSLTLGTSYQIFSLAELEALGVDAAYDVTNTTDVHRQVSAFYDQAGTGAELWLMVVAKTVTLAQICDKDLLYAQKLIEDSQGSVRILAVSRTPDGAYTYTRSNGLDPDVTAAIDKAQSMAEANLTAIRPHVVVIGGRDWSGVAGDLANLHTRNDKYVSIALTGQASGSYQPNVGIILGRLAKYGVEENIGKVKNGDLAIADAYLTSGNTVESHANALGSIHDKGYIIYRQYPNVAGYYFNDDPTATAATDDIRSITNARVIQKAVVIAHTVYVQEVNNNVLVDAATGRLPVAQIKNLQSLIETAINNSMTANEEISGCAAYINPAQDIVATSQLTVQLSIVPVGYTKTINVNIGFTTSI